MVYVPRRKRRTGKPRVYRKRRGLGVKSVKTIARQVVNEGRERKIKQAFITNYPLSVYNSGDINYGANTVSMMCLSPNDLPGTFPTVANLSITQGVDTDQRVGSRIEMKKGVARLYFNPTIYNTYNTQPQPMLVQVFIGYDRTTGNGQPSPSLPQFFEDSGNASSPVGWALDTFKRINKERYVIFNRRTYKIGQAEFFGTANSPPQQYYTNNDFKYSARCTIDYTKHLIKHVKYSVDSDNTPTTRQLWMWWMITPATGSTISTSRQITMNGELTLHYTDA